MMRAAARGRLAVVAATMIAAATALACANVSEPPGGPPDVQAPVILSITPESGAVNPRLRQVEVRFDEVISETPRGVQDLDALVFISPKSGTPEVDWGRSRITIRPSRGWRPNTVYSVSISPGITDLRNNAIDSTIRLVFSTGGAIPNTRLSGATFDWVQGAPAGRTLVEAIAPDSTTYQTLSDSAGRYELRSMPPGPYVVRAVLDRNSNRELDPLEPWDTVRVTLVQSTNADLYTFQRDTVGLRISDIAILDSGRTLRVVFDKPYGPDQVLTPDRVTIRRPDSSALRVVGVITPGQRATLDSLRAKARADSIARAGADTSAVGRARADSAAQRRRADSVANAEREAREARRLAALRGGRPAPLDTTPPPKFDRPKVFTELLVLLGEQVPAATRLRVQVNGIRSLPGTVRSPAREFVTPPLKRDSTSPPARRDSTALPPHRP